MLSRCASVASTRTRFHAYDPAGRKQALHGCAKSFCRYAVRLGVACQLKGRTSAAGAWSDGSALGDALVKQFKEKLVDVALGGRPVRGAVARRRRNERQAVPAQFDLLAGAPVVRLLDLEFSDIRIVFVGIREVQHGADGIAPIDRIRSPGAVGHAAHRGVVEQHNGCCIFAGDLPQHCEKAADLATRDGFAVEHGSNRIDDDQDRPVRSDPGFDLQKKRGFRYFA